MGPRLSCQNCKLFMFLLSINSQKRLGYKESNTKYRSLTWNTRSHVRILIYQTWPIVTFLSIVPLILFIQRQYIGDWGRGSRRVRPILIWNLFHTTSFFKGKNPPNFWPYQETIKKQFGKPIIWIYTLPCQPCPVRLYLRGSKRLFWLSFCHY